MKYLFRAFLLSLMTIMVLGFSGCSSDDSGTTTTEQTDDGGTTTTTDDGTTTDGDTTDGTTTDDATTVSYAGDLTLSGSVDTSSLAAQDQAETRARSRASRADGDEIVKLYVLDANGDMVDTNLTCTVNDGNYSCPNIAGDQEYIVRYVQDLGDDRVLEMRTSATVADADPDPVVIDPITTMVVEALVQAVEDALSGVTADENLVESIIASVKTAIVDTMNTLVQTGVIQIPSMIVDADFTTIETETAVETTNENLSDAAGIVTTNDAVSQSITAASNAAEGALFATLSDDEKMQAVFDVLGWDDLPGWVLSLFADHYTDMKDTYTFRWLFEASNLVALPADEIQIEDIWDLKLFNELGYSAEDMATIATNIATSINAQLNDETIFDVMVSYVEQYYTIQAKDTADRTEEDIAFLADFPATIAEVFPEESLAGVTFDTQFSNMAQLMLSYGFVSYYDGYVNDLIQDELSAKLDDDGHEGEYFDSQLRWAAEYLFADTSEDLVTSMFSDTELYSYMDMVSVSQIRGSADSVYDEENAQEISALRISTSIDKMAWDFGDFPVDAISATLTYPKADGSTGSIALVYNGDWEEYVLEPLTCDMTGCFANEDQLVSDFVSGDYTVTFTYNDGETTETYTRTDYLYFIPNVTQYRPTLTTPQGMPQWDSAWNNLSWDELQNLPEYIAFQEANDAYWQAGVPTFEPNVDTNGDDVNDTLEGMVIRWEAPDLGDLVLPDNIVLAYNVDVRLFSGNWDDCQDDWEACNTPIYSTWDDDRLITTTSITLPVALEENEVSTDPYAGDSNYEIWVQAMFVDRDTGKEIAMGNGSNAQFKVGQSTELTGEEVVTFSGNVALSEYSMAEEIPTDVNLTVALFAESWGEDEDGYWTNTRELVSTGTYDETEHTFSIDVNTSVLEDAIGMNKNIQIVAFEDMNGDGEWQDWDNATADNEYYAENSYWLENWFWVDTWGDTVIHVGDNEGGEESYRLVSGEDIEIEGLTISIW